MLIEKDNLMLPRRLDKNARGFSLVEMLTVITILVLLIGIIAPSVNNAMKVAKMRKTEAAISMLSTACEQYKMDFEEFPPSEITIADIQMGSVGEGKEIIVLLLTGYAGDGSSSAIPDTGNFDDDDGKTGFGFRTVTRGQVYGPYNGAETLNTSETSTPVFKDAFGNDILYYRYDEANTQYQESHNNTPRPSSTYLEACATVRKDFLFLSPGPDGVYDASPADADAIKDSDDVTNLE